jgi:hypothetical protein
MDFKSDTPNQEENTSEITQQDTAWLKDLGIQSWQAELVMSGLIITGLFQMPDLFIKWVEPSIIQSGELEYSFLKFASIIFLMGIDVLVIIFGIHLLLRGIWIALLGLNSVYPNGIDVTSKKGMGEKQWQKAKEKYPDLTAYCAKLDGDCSVLFSSATVITIMVSSFSICVLAFYKLSTYLMSVFSITPQHIIAVGVVIYFLFLVVNLLLWYLSKKYPDNKRIEKIVTRFSNVIGVIFSLYIFQKPVGYITSIQMSNSKSKYGFIIMMIISLLMGFVVGKQMNKSNAFYDFETDKYFTFNNQPHELLAFNYENLIDKEAEIYTSIIQSDVINDDFLKVFIPNIARERERMNLKEYSIKERFKMNNAQREAIEKERFEVYKAFNSIYINDTLQANLNYQFYEHPQASERGLLVYIPSENFVKGRNILEIRKNYFSKDSIQKVVKIPFFYKKE